MPQPTGHRKLLEQIRADGVGTMFGNPGSSEEGLLDEIARFPDLRYVLGLQEAAVVGMADGYAQATHRPAVVQLHCSVGLGNAIGSLFHARQRRSPLVVIAGEAGIGEGMLEAHMSADLVAMARPVTKYAARAEHPASLLRLFRRCFKVAATPPFGPVFLSVPQDILDAVNEEPVVPTQVPSTRVVPEPALIAAAAEMLGAARRPVILMGDGVAHSGATEEIGRLAETIGAGVWGEMSSELNMPWDHPLYCGLAGHMFGHDSARIVAEADAVLIVGTYVFPEVFPLLTNPFNADAKVIHVDLDAYAIGKNHPVTLGLVSDPKLTLHALADVLSDGASEAQRQAVKERAEAIGARNRDALARARAADEAQANAVPLHMTSFAAELARHLPEDAIVFDESLTHFPELVRWVVPVRPGSFFQTPGGTLGVGIPGAIGVKLARPEQTVIGLTGDGGAMYTYQALWTAAHLGVGAKFIVCNNRSYRLLKINLVDYWRARGLDPSEFPATFPPPFDVDTPPIDFVMLAKSMGVPGVRVEEPAEMAPAIRRMLETDGPFLIDLILERDVPRGTT
ncbi:MAG: thiamine pyrophosphate-binding protein [Rhodospirillales bacterium]|nr:thiamine pyrophosphate-binding protein [Rhodospirillales bacterium]